jgi:hypothetical protein
VGWYDTRTNYALDVTYDEKLGRIARVRLSDVFAYAEPEVAVLAINDWPAAGWLRAQSDRERLCFSASPDGAGQRAHADFEWFEADAPRLKHPGNEAVFWGLAAEGRGAALSRLSHHV